jgi:hypothetical protein
MRIINGGDPRMNCVDPHHSRPRLQRRIMKLFNALTPEKIKIVEETAMEH